MLLWPEGARRSDHENLGQLLHACETISYEIYGLQCTSAMIEFKVP